jgi:hypothetical protein
VATDVAGSVLLNPWGAASCVKRCVSYRLAQSGHIGCKLRSAGCAGVVAAAQCIVQVVFMPWPPSCFVAAHADTMAPFTAHSAAIKRQVQGVCWPLHLLVHNFGHVCVTWCQPCIGVCVNLKQKTKKSFGAVLLTPLANLDVPLGRCLHLGNTPRYLVWRVPFSGESPFLYKIF